MFQGCAHKGLASCGVSSNSATYNEQDCYTESEADEPKERPYAKVPAAEMYDDGEYSVIGQRCRRQKQHFVKQKLQLDLHSIHMYMSKIGAI